MSRNWYWLGAAMPLVVALTTIARADGPSVVLTDSVRYEGRPVSLNATNVTLPELAKELSAALGSEVRIEGAATSSVTLSLNDVPAAVLMSRTAEMLGSHWQILYHLSTREPARPPEPASGVVLDLKFPDLSCQAAAAVVARMAGGRVEHDGDLTGQVSLVGTAMPVEEAMNAITRAAHATWRRIYVMKVDALPQSLLARKPEETSAQPANSSTKAPKAPGLFSNHINSAGHPIKLTRRDPKHPSPRTYGDGVKPISASLEDIQRQQMLGLYGPFFLLDSQDGRAAAMKRFQAGLETQLKRLQALPASQRFITTSMTRNHFQQLIDDFANLDKDQQKEAQGLYDYAKEQLASPLLKQR